jgi:hypothetical protein
LAPVLQVLKREGEDSQLSQIFQQPGNKLIEMYWPLNHACGLSLPMLWFPKSFCLMCIGTEKKRMIILEKIRNQRRAIKMPV